MRTGGKRSGARSARRAMSYVLLGAAAAGAVCREEAAALSDAPSVVILIDQSASMRTADPGLARYRCAARFLDRLAATRPGAEAAVIVFSDILHFDPDGYARAAFPGDPARAEDGYVPFTRLDRLFPGGRNGLDTVRAYLSAEGTGPKLATHERSGFLSDFPMAFEAARAALRASGSLRERRAIVLLTDGGMSAAVASGRDPASARFLAGGDLPVTYVVRLDPSAGGGSGADWDKLIARIAGNGYSPANPRSAGFAIPGFDNPDPDWASRVLSDLAAPVPASDPRETACEDGLPPLRFAGGNPIARLAGTSAPRTGPHWSLSGNPDAEGTVHVTLEADGPFELEARAFSRLGEAVSSRRFRVDETAFAALPGASGGRGRVLDLAWDGWSDGGSPAATGAYLLSLSARFDGKGGSGPVTRAITRRVGIIR